MQETQEMRVQSPGQEDSLEKEMATGFSILTWKIPWTEEPGQAIVHGTTKSWKLSDQVHTPTKDGVCFPTHWQWTVPVTLTKGTWVVSTPAEPEIDYCNFFFFLVLCPWVIKHEDCALETAAPSVWDKKAHVEQLNLVSSLEPSLEQDHLV